MSQLDVCIETVFTDLPYPERIKKISDIGYKAIEFWHPEGTWDGNAINTALSKDADVIRQVCEETGTKVNGFVVNAWDGLFGGNPSKAADKTRFLEQVNKMIEFAGKIDCRCGVIMPGLTQPDLSQADMRKNIESAFGDALEIAEKDKFILLVEPLNTVVDHAGFYLESLNEAAEIVRGFKSPYMKLLYDIYHMQIMGGNVVASIEEHCDIIGHIHVAGVPGRAEPDECELYYPYIFSRAVEAGYEGWFGLEYFPNVDSETSLKRQLNLVAMV